MIKYLRSLKQRNKKKREGKESLVVSSYQEEKNEQQPNEPTDTAKYENLFQEALKKGNKKEMSKACIRLQHASNIVGQTPKTCVALGHVYRREDDKEVAIYYYEKALEIAHSEKDNFYETEALRGLGHTYREAGENEKAICYYEQALILAQVGNNKMQEAEVFLGLAHAYENDEQHENAIEKYRKAKEIAKEHHCKWEETEACRGLGKAFRDLGDIKTAQQYFHQALDIAPNESYKKDISLIHLGLAHTYRSNGEYERAIESYENAETVLAQERDCVLEEMSAYLGLGYCLLKIGRIKEGEEYFTKAEKTAEMKWDILPAVLRVMNHSHQADIKTDADQATQEEENVQEDETVKEQKIIEDKENGTEKEIFQKNTFPLNESKESSCEEDTTVAKDLSEVLDPSSFSEDVHPNKDEFVEKTTTGNVLVKKVPDSVYTYQVSIKDGLTEEIKTKMAEDVKRSAYMYLLNENDVQFSGFDGPIYQIAKKCVCKSVPTNRPGHLPNLLARFNRSIGRITCGDAQGTCFIAVENFVVTCYHVYLDFIEERKKPNQLTLPIRVAFDYYKLGGLNNAVVVEVDESQVPIYYSKEFDYILLCLKQSSNLEDREPLGEFVRSYHLDEGLLCITGFPENRELREETCVVVEAAAKKKLYARQHQMGGGVHLASIQAFFSKIPHRVAYDCSLYRGSSGSPGFDMNGKIVVLHAQGYILNVNEKHYPLMEFGINFGVICAHLQQEYGLDIADQFFPNRYLQDDVGLIDVDPDSSDLNKL